MVTPPPRTDLRVANQGNEEVCIHRTYCVRRRPTHTRKSRKSRTLSKIKKIKKTPKTMVPNTVKLQMVIVEENDATVTIFKHYFFANKAKPSYVKSIACG